jgi:uncharacterized protein YbjT (DUF2867 family)
MMEKQIHAVTGAFGFTGSYIAAKLLEQGKDVITLTNSQPRSDPFGGRVGVCPFNFDQPQKLSESLAGVQVLYNTYWQRFNEVVGEHSQAYRNSITLFEAARSAGVERIVHISITNPSEDSPIDYFREKAQLEQALRDLGLSHAILRPAVIFGPNSILINNIAWSLRKLPVFGYFGAGRYRIRPVHVADLAELAVAAGARRENELINAVGPDDFEYRELVGEIAAALGLRRLILPAPEFAGYLIGVLIGKAMGDTLMTRDELKALTGGLLSVDGPATGSTSLRQWLRENADSLGRDYARMPKR